MATTFDTNQLAAMSRKELVSLAKQTGACKANAKSDVIIKNLMEYAKKNEPVQSENVENKIENVKEAKKQPAKKEPVTKKEPVVEPVQQQPAPVEQPKEETVEKESISPIHTEEDLQAMKKAELVALAKEAKIEMKSNLAKAKFVEALAAHFLAEAEAQAAKVKKMNMNSRTFTVQWDGSNDNFGLQMKWNKVQFVVNGMSQWVAMKDAVEGHSAASVLNGSVLFAINGVKVAGKAFNDILNQLKECKGKGDLTFLKPLSALKNVDTETDLEDLLNKFDQVMHVTKNDLAEPRIKCDVTHKELIPDFDEVSKHVCSDSFREGMKNIAL